MARQRGEGNEPRGAVLPGGTDAPGRKGVSDSRRAALLCEVPVQYARPAAILYLVIAVAAVVAHMYMPTTVFGADGFGSDGGAGGSAGGLAAESDELAMGAGGLAAAVPAQQALYIGAGVGGELVILLSEVVLSVLLFGLLAPVDRIVALIAAAARLVMSAIHGFNLVFYYLILNVAKGGAPGGAVLGSTEGGSVGLVRPDAIDAVITALLDAQSVGFTIGIAFLVIHMGALGYLMWRSGYIPRWIGALFLLAGGGYLVDSFGTLLVSSYVTTPVLVAIAISFAEIVFPVWLLVRGIRVERPV